MKLRVLTALVLAPPVLFLVGWSPETSSLRALHQGLFLAVLVATVEIGLYEFFSLCRQAGLEAMTALGYAAGAALCLAQFVELRRPGTLGFVVLCLTVLFTLALALLRMTDLKRYLGAAASTVFGILYVGFTLSWLVPLRFAEPRTGRKLIFLLFLVIWSGDICAYFVGRSIGRTPLVPRISPKKTVEGALAGFAGSLLVAAAFTRWFWETADLKTVMLLAAIIAVAGQVGDLVESGLKRGAELKDSGSILPGHGGLLDRIDSLLFGAPALWLALTLKDLLR